MRKEILLVEDNPGITEGLQDTFAAPEYQLYTAKSISEAREIVQHGRPGLVLLDVMLPDGSGFQFYKEELGPRQLDVIFLTAMDDEGDIVNGLELGAQDYVTKPFSVKELVARVNRVFQRKQQQTVITVAGIVYDLDKARVTRGETEIRLSKLELRILQLLFENHDKVVSRNAVIDCIWEATGNDVFDHTVTVYMKRIRQKLGVDIIKTVKGVGYRIDTGQEAL